MFNYPEYFQKVEDLLLEKNEEIVRLRSALRKIADHGTLINKLCGHARQMAREALNTNKKPATP